ncbi:MAG: hypothetical protein CL678_10120 [Bdellovibrionaceae bacterium]|nr:hypothetical protein [Pseudobdellovibrionaceae bacterium]|tara:strand:- start:3086 stop:3367 length:282 start_codon:yes stop_codon:yes gene_type:complete
MVIKDNQSGQVLVEYILLASIIAIVALGLINALNQMNLIQEILRPIKNQYAATYRYGHPKAKGFENGEEPKHHAMARVPEGENFRIFIMKGRR